MTSKTKPLRLIEEAQTEYDLQYDQLLAHSIPKADRFRAEIIKGFQAIASKPNGFGYVRGYSFRSYGPTKIENYRIAYLETESEITVLAIYFSGLPDPLYWLERAF